MRSKLLYSFQSAPEAGGSNLSRVLQDLLYINPQNFLSLTKAKYPKPLNDPSEICLDIGTKLGKLIMDFPQTPQSARSQRCTRVPNTSLNT